MSTIKDDNYLTIQGWQINQLGLKGNELIIYAAIYGFTQAEGQWFTGSQQYLADWTNSTTRGVRKALASLEEKGLLLIGKNGKGNKYRAIRPEIEEQSSANENIEEQSSAIQRNKVPLIEEQSSYNNIDNKLDDKLAFKESIKESPKPEDVVKLYNETCVSLPHVKTLTAKRIKAVNARLKTYSIADIQKAFSMAEASKFLKGDNDRGWRADFDWLINENNMVKVLEERYLNVASVKKGYSESGTSRDKQYSDLEQRIFNFGSRSD